MTTMTDDDNDSSSDYRWGQTWRRQTATTTVNVETTDNHGGAAMTKYNDNDSDSILRTATAFVESSFLAGLRLRLRRTESLSVTVCSTSDRKQRSFLTVSRTWSKITKMWKVKQKPLSKRLREFMKAIRYGWNDLWKDQSAGLEWNRQLAVVMTKG